MLYPGRTILDLLEEGHDLLTGDRFFFHAAGDGIHRVHAGQIGAAAAHTLDCGFNAAAAIALAVADEDAAGDGEALHLVKTERVAHAGDGLFHPVGFAAVFHNQPPRQVEGGHVDRIIVGHRISPVTYDGVTLFYRGG